MFNLILTQSETNLNSMKNVKIQPRFSKEKYTIISQSFTHIYLVKMSSIMNIISLGANIGPGGLALSFKIFNFSSGVERDRNVVFCDTAVLIVKNGKLKTYKLNKIVL